MAHKSTEERREEIVQAMLRVMAEHGYAHATINRIADEAGLTSGLIHYHFKTKQAILLALLEELIDNLQVFLQMALRTSETPQHKLRTIIDVFLRAGDNARPEAVATWVTIAAESIRQPEVARAFEAAIERLITDVQAVIVSGVDAGVFDTGSLSIEATSAAIMACVQGYFTLAASARAQIPHGSAAPATLRMAEGLLGLESGELE